MRVLPLFVLFLILPALSFSQQWVDIGFKGAYGTGFWYNSAYLDDGGISNRMKAGYSLGGKLGYNLSERHEITVGGAFSQFQQEFVYDIALTTYSKVLTLKTTDILIMYRLNSEGRYFEIGPQISLLKSATEVNEDPDIGSLDALPLMAENYTSVVLGFGSYMMGSDNFGITLGARIKYALTDVIGADGQALNYPATLLPDLEYAPSHPLVAELVLEFNYDLGYLAKANCGKRQKILFF